MKINCPTEIDFEKVEEVGNHSEFFDNHKDSPSQSKIYKTPIKEDLNKENSFDKPPQMSNIFTKLYSTSKDKSENVVKFGNSLDKKVQQGIRFVSAKPNTVPRSPLLRTKYRLRGVKSKEISKNFKATPIQTSTFKFHSKPKTTVIPESPLLHTKVRAKEREDYEMEKEKEKAEQEIALQEQNEILKEIDRKKIQEERIKTTFKATKVPEYKGITIKKSKLPLTTPKSPNFSKHGHDNDSTSANTNPELK